MSESTSIQMEHSPGNDKPKISGWTALSEFRSKQRASAFILIKDICSSRGLDLVVLNSRPDVISTKLMANEPGVRTCLICSKSMFQQESWIFVTGSKPGKYTHHKKRAAHVSCVEATEANGEA
jgi:hypothetical protein